MSKPQLKRFIYKEALENSLVTMNKALNHLEQLSRPKSTISASIIERDKEKTLLNLELELARYCILLRKMNENGFITYDSDERADINAIIHSNRFDFTSKGVFVYSQRGREQVQLEKLFALGQKVDAILAKALGEEIE